MRFYHLPTISPSLLDTLTHLRDNGYLTESNFTQELKESELNVLSLREKLANIQQEKENMLNKIIQFE